MKQTASGFQSLLFWLSTLVVVLVTGCAGGAGDDGKGVGRLSQALSCSSVSSSISPSSAVAGASITFTTSSGGCATPEYRINHLRPGSSSWDVAADYSAANSSWVWNSATSNGGGLEPGGWHTFQVLARDQGAGVAYEAVATYDYYLTPPSSVACTSVSTTFSPSAAAVGTSVTLTSSATACSTPQYRIHHLRPGSSTYQLESDYSTSNSSWVWNTATGNAGAAETAGWHTFQILVRAQGSSSTYDQVATYDYYLTSASAIACTGVSSSVNPSSATVGAAITFTNSATACSTPLYRIHHLRPGSGTWQLESDYSTSNSSWVWNTQTANGGSAESSGWHSFQILARAQGSSSAYEAIKSIDYYLSPAYCSSISSTISPASGASAGATVTFSSSSTGCGAPEYRINHLAPGGSWVVAADYSPINSTWAWDTSNEATGWHSFQILVRAQGSSSAYQSIAAYDYYLSASSACSSAGISFSPASPGTVGQSITVSATSSGCAFPTYQYSYQAPGSSSWTILQDWTSSSSAVWNTTLAATGTYNFQVLARAAGATSTQATGTGSYTLNAASTSYAVGLGGGYAHMCELTSSGKIGCWGYNGHGELGASSGGFSYSATPLDVTGITQGISIGVGYSSTCAVISGGSVNCWGQNQAGQLGNGTTTDSQTPVVVSGLTNVSAVAVGVAHACAVQASGAVKCWGYNSQGQLGDGTGTNRTTPVSASGISTAVQVAGGYYHTCALLSDGTVKCWGLNNNGELGNGTTTKSLSPVAVSGLSGVTSISSGSFSNCAVRSDHTVWCWGANVLYGELGDGTTTSRSTPVQVTGVTTATAVSIGPNHACASLQDGTAVCWGSNGYGQLGNNSTTTSFTAVPVSSLSTVVSVAVSQFASCATLSDGSAACWGRGSEGVLGNGAQDDSLVPVAVSAIP